MTSRVYIGGAAGFAGDRTDAAGPLVEALAQADGPRFLMFETLAERTLALSQLERRRDPARGYNPALDRFITPILARCLANKHYASSAISAPPILQRRPLRIQAIAREQGLPAAAHRGGRGRRPSAAAGRAGVGGARNRRRDCSAGASDIVAANVYLGAQPIAAGARPAAPTSWSPAASPIPRWPRVLSSTPSAGVADDWDRLAAGTLAGHLLECGAQVTGGYFADPGVKGRAGPRRASAIPIAEIDANGAFVITKPAGTGGRVDRQTVIEQMLYEIHDPAPISCPTSCSISPTSTVEELGPDRVRIIGARGNPAPETLKATVCVDARRARRGRDFLCRTECRRARPAGGRDHSRPAAQRAPGFRIPHRCDRRQQRPRRRRRRAATAGLRTRSRRPPTLRRAVGRTPRCRASCSTRSRRFIAPGPAGGAGVRRHVTPRLASASCLIERRFADPALA